MAVIEGRPEETDELQAIRRTEIMNEFHGNNSDRAEARRQSRQFLALHSCFSHSHSAELFFLFSFSVFYSKLRLGIADKLGRSIKWAENEAKLAQDEPR